MAIKTIFFDMGNTLFDMDIADMSGVKESIKEVRKLYHMREDVFQGLNLFNLAITESFHHLAKNEEFKLAGKNNPEKMYLMAIQGWCKRLIELTGNSPAGKEVESVFNAFVRGLSLSHSLYPGVKETLYTLADIYELGIISNALSKNARGMLENSGIGGLFKSVIISGEEGVEKPDPGIFNTALEKAQIKPSEALMVGDDFERDIFGAGNIGMKTAWIRKTGHNSPSGLEPDYVIKKIPELLHLRINN